MQWTWHLKLIRQTNKVISFLFADMEEVTTISMIECRCGLAWLGHLTLEALDRVWEAHAGREAGFWACRSGRKRDAAHNSGMKQYDLVSCLKM